MIPSSISKRSAALLAGFVLLLVVLAGWKLYDSGLLSSEEALRAWVESYGVFGPLVIMGVIMLEVIIAPLPGGLPPIVAGFVFGPIEGAIYAWIANVAASVVTFLLARWFGKSFAARLAELSELKRYAEFVHTNSWLLFLAYSIPFLFPVDLLNISLGLTRIPIRRYLKIMMAGFVINVMLPSFLGSVIDIDRIATVGYALTGVVVVTLLAYVFKRWLEKVL